MSEQENQISPEVQIKLAFLQANVMQKDAEFMQARYEFDTYLQANNLTITQAPQEAPDAEDTEE